MAESVAKPKTILVFDVDGTLTPARQVITREMRDFLVSTKSRVDLAVVGGSDMKKILEQMDGPFAQITKMFNFLMSENGLVGFQGTVPLKRETIGQKLGEEQLQRFINHCLHYIADLQLPAKRGTFVEFRASMINVSPVGRSCTQKEREQFVEYDQKHNIRNEFIADLRKNFPPESFGLHFSIGGQISVDAFPLGWDKSYAIQFFEQAGYTNIHFFGDRTAPNGNDHEIFADSRTVGHTVTSPEDTRAQVQQLLSDLAL